MKEPDIKKTKQKDNTYWKSRLTPEVYAITRKKGTERPGSGRYYHHSETGFYHCICCNVVLFKSTEKYNSGSGWPSFYAPVNATVIKEYTDHSLGMQRTEIVCSNCDAHLGHVFSDGPEPTGLRYCVNSLSLDFKSSS
ncbi:MAG: peptide-methionine (R)-S-oxide reductase MsrB [Cyanobacteria bacterium P01_H01_bin.74]